MRGQLRDTSPPIRPYTSHVYIPEGGICDTECRVTKNNSNVLCVSWLVFAIDVRFIPLLASKGNIFSSHRDAD